MAGRWKNDLNWSDVTPKAAFLSRRQIVAGLGATGLIAGARPATAATEELVPNTFEEITSYNNFYEFGWDKGDPKKYGHMLTTDPWAIEVDGLVERPGTYD
ncbi:MAG: mononuclear molybdenum enzyme YedY, partial [Thalassovita sp.]|nr:mononuclear molybdenum enzyme YedY [Thalassovita sp.]